MSYVNNLEEKEFKRMIITGGLAPDGFLARDRYVDKATKRDCDHLLFKAVATNSFIPLYLNSFNDFCEQFAGLQFIKELF